MKQQLKNQKSKAGQKNSAVKKKLPEKKFNNIWWLAMILVAAMVVFSPGLKNQFISWDDTVYVTENPNLALTSQNIAHSFQYGESHGMYVPLTALSFSINHYFSKINPKPYLMTNLFLHLINIILVFILLQKLFKKNAITLLGTLLFALHPMQAESVSFISGRRDLLYALFFLASLISYVGFLNHKKKSGYVVTLLFFMLSLFSKGQALILPLVLLGIDALLQRKESLSRKLMEKIPFFLLSLVFILITFSVKQASPEFRIENEVMAVPLWQRLIYACYGFIMYIVNLIIPYKLSLIHPYPLKEAIPAVFWFFPLLVCGVIAGWVYLLKRNRTMAFGLLFFALTIVMVLQIIPNSYGIMNDHYVYLPCIGLFIVLASALTVVTEKKQYRNILWGVAGIYVLALSAFTFNRSKVFRDDISVFSDVIKKYPDSYLAYNNRATAEMNRKNAKNAFSDFNKALQVYPQSANVYNNRATLYISTGNIPAALKDLNEALRLKPDFANAYGNRGIAKSAIRDTTALQDFNKAISLHPGDPKLYYNRGAYWLQTGHSDRGCLDVKKAKAMGLKQGNPMIDRACI